MKLSHKNDACPKWVHWLLCIQMGLALAFSTQGCSADETTRTSSGSELGYDYLKRMSAAQYNNTVRDLFPGVELDLVIFPFQLSVDGFDNNVAVNTATPGLTDAYYRNAVKVGTQVVEQLSAVVSCDPLTKACAENYLLDLVQRAWRRDFKESEREQFLADVSEWFTTYDEEGALSLAISYILQVPEFVYLPELGGASVELDGTAFVPLTSWEVATRLSYFIWNTTPDAKLLSLARADQLQDREVIATEAWRMLNDSKAHQGVLGFYRQFLDLDVIGTNSLDFSVYLNEMDGDAGSDYLHQILQPAMRYEPEIFVLDEVFRGTGKLSGLLTSSKTYVTPATAQLYGVEISEGTDDAIHWETNVEAFGFDYAETFYGVQLNAQERAGILTQLGFLNAHSKPVYPSPILRGVFVKDRFLCAPAPPPPGDVPALDEMNEGVAPRTNRERYENHSRSPACSVCHESIDAIGFTFENYDSLGQFRTQDNGYPVDSSGAIMGTEDMDGPVANAVELSKNLSQSKTVHDCHTKQWFRYAFARTETSGDKGFLGTLGDGFWGSEGDIPELIVNIASSFPFRHKRAAQ
ncbi:MAG: DUF1592 domain-containing protein [Deltaproteobacteria bacterium]|nr:DUF1592 domain-containing protein [Deltaproteobacteria bacterium]